MFGGFMYCIFLWFWNTQGFRAFRGQLCTIDLGKAKKTSHKSLKIAGTELAFGVVWEENAAPFDAGCCFVQGIGPGKVNTCNMLQ